MCSNAELVFALSPHAIALLMQGAAPVEPQLRAVLMLVDGYTPVAQYEPFLRSLAPLEPKFLALEAQGLLLRVGRVSPDAVQAFRASVEAGGPVSTFPPIDACSPASGFTPLP